ncbi:hypothetical protein ACFC26_21815 [Kitasatospora purpeofusca]|uniref:hypothetical protein n=1 Tax=Kitasatospora purpeofusca TaxID=67352 RepID=UPI0035D8C9F3
MHETPSSGTEQGTLFDLTPPAVGVPPGPTVGGCCACGAAIERPLNGPRPACTHPERIAAQAAAQEWASSRCSARMAGNFARWFVEAGPHEPGGFDGAYERWRVVMGRWFDHYEAQESEGGMG